MRPRCPALHPLSRGKLPTGKTLPASHHRHTATPVAQVLHARRSLPTRAPVNTSSRRTQAMATTQRGTGAASDPAGPRAEARATGLHGGRLAAHEYARNFA